tara:strand:- start:875 stop:1624 length:750 start_codon:yes stop_codon:yes gene_type:complete
MLELTVLIPTHACKREVIGPLTNVDQKNATAPSTRLMQTVISNIKEYLYDIKLNFIIGLDHKTDVDLSNEYLSNLKKLSEVNDNIDVISYNTKYSDRVMTTITATNNFLKLISNCNTELFLLWEHDWVFKRPIDNNKLNIQKLNIEMLRFNQFHNATLRDEEIISTDEIGVTTTAFSNNPFITSKEIWYSKYNDLALDIPNWWGQYGAFIEGPINRHMVEKNLNYKIHLYGDLNDQPYISHLNGQIWRQ